MNSKYFTFEAFMLVLFFVLTPFYLWAEEKASRSPTETKSVETQPAQQSDASKAASQLPPSPEAKEETKKQAVESETVKEEKKDKPSKEEKPPKPVYVPAATDVLEDKFLVLGIGVGGTVSPEAFSAKINVDYIFDGIFSLGPYIQGSFAQDLTYLMFLLDGKFRFSVPGVDPDVKFMALLGGGYLRRRISGVVFSNVTGHVGIGGEYFISNVLSVGLEFILNVASSPSERYFMNFFAGASYYL